MIHHDQQLPDILRPTEIHDFGELFSMPRRGLGKIAMAVTAVAALLILSHHVVGATSAPAAPAVVLAAK